MSRDTPRDPGVSAPAAFNEVLVVDSSREAHSAIRLCFSASGKNTHATRTNEDALRFLEHQQVDLIFAEISTPPLGAEAPPELDGVALTRDVRRRELRVPIVVTGAQASRERIIMAMNAGANFYLERPITPASVQDCLDAIVTRCVPPEGQVPRRSRLAAGGPGDPLRSLPLSDREKEIAVKVSEGLSNREIAQAMGISEQTVRNHLTKTYRKLLINSRSQLARMILLLD